MTKEQTQNMDLCTLNNSMNYENVRLSSFHSRPHNFKTPASKLAKAGFYYTGHDDTVMCFSCHLNVGGWEKRSLTIDPFRIHQKYSRNCGFLIGTDNTNVPYKYKVLADEAKVIVEKMNEIKARSESTARNVTRNTENVATPSTSQTTLHNTAHTTTHTLTHNTPHNVAYQQQYVFSNSNEVMDGQQDFKNEQCRVVSFKNWPTCVVIRPEELAKYGFYYVGTEDRVQCAFCNGTLRNWDPHDSAYYEHKRHFPTCPFIRDPLSCGNIPLSIGIDFKEQQRQQQQEDDYKLGIVYERAYRPDMASQDARINSFKNGVFITKSNKSIEEFADAGYYFTGYEDNLKCFFCDGGLKSWEKGEDPWFEHARWFSKCGFLRMKKGDDYVNDVKLQMKKISQPYRLKYLHQVDQTLVDEFMESEIVTNAIQCGFQFESIKKTVYERYAKLKSPFPNLESLINVLCDDDESDNMEFLNSQNSSTITSSIKDKHNDVTKKPQKGRKRKINESQINFIREATIPKLENEIEKLKDDRLCKVCLNSPLAVLFLPCRHLTCCADCGAAVQNCPICRAQIVATISAFL